MKIDTAADLDAEDETGFVWTFLDEAFTRRSRRSWPALRPPCDLGRPHFTVLMRGPELAPVLFQAVGELRDNPYAVREGGPRAEDRHRG